MNTTRRRFVQGGLATGAIVAAPATIRAQTTPPVSRTIRAVLHGDLRVFDPIWTTANMTSYHAGMVYDTLFGVERQIRRRSPRWSRNGRSRTTARPIASSCATVCASPTARR